MKLVRRVRAQFLEFLDPLQSRTDVLGPMIRETADAMLTEENKLIFAHNVRQNRQSVYALSFSERLIDFLLLLSFQRDGDIDNLGDFMRPVIDALIVRSVPQLDSIFEKYLSRLVLPFFCTWMYACKFFSLIPASFLSSFISCILSGFFFRSFVLLFLFLGAMLGRSEGQSTENE